MITCPCCSRHTDAIIVEENILAFLGEMRPETWISFDVLQLKFLIMNHKARKEFSDLMADLVERGILEKKYPKCRQEHQKYRLTGRNGAIPG